MKAFIESQEQRRVDNRCRNHSGGGLRNAWPERIL
jgi:hypothetical protein